ncbi:MAG TPA: tRNA (adenosine(37)-N6)-threonylcarbamoyltransferase complex transferase subunit TsaD [Pirellulales bacterium]|nr:tRNA (adenosine(37)-N6)-threonylcarbamoyltransferase complex transferase subunit TsaD [Pirellulales bacterium]
MLLLAIETTCDETAAAVIRDDLAVLGAAVASQEAIHRRFQGVVPELASRAHVDRIVPVVDQALSQAGVALTDLNCVAVANTPGLAGSLLVGLSAAKSLALALGLPLVAINHVFAHLYACQLGEPESIFPCVGLVVSGGHSSLFRCDDALTFELLGGTIDDAAGEAFDKVATLLGLPYPGGPAIEAAARAGNPSTYAFPRSFLHEPARLEFSFSGLKTAVRYALPAGVVEKRATLEHRTVADLAASFQQAVVDVLVAKAVHALTATGYQTLCVGGGVAANAAIRSTLESAARRHGFQLHIARRDLCTDNAVMGALAWERFRAGWFEELDLDIHPGLMRDPKVRARQNPQNHTTTL